MVATWLSICRARIVRLVGRVIVSLLHPAYSTGQAGHRRTIAEPKPARDPRFLPNVAHELGYKVRVHLLSRSEVLQVGCCWLWARALVPHRAPHGRRRWRRSG